MGLLKGASTPLRPVQWQTACTVARVKAAKCAELPSLWLERGEERLACFPVSAVANSAKQMDSGGRGAGVGCGVLFCSAEVWAGIIVN